MTSYRKTMAAKVNPQDSFDFLQAEAIRRAEGCDKHGHIYKNPPTIWDDVLICVCCGRRARRPRGSAGWGEYILTHPDRDLPEVKE